MLTITTPGTGSALFEVTSPNLSAIGLPQGAIVLRSVQPLSPGCLALAQKAGRLILGILLAESPDLLYQPGLLIRMDDTWTLHAVEVRAGRSFTHSMSTNCFTFNVKRRR